MRARPQSIAIAIAGISFNAEAMRKPHGFLGY